MRILGVDPALQRTGYGIIDSGKEEVAMIGGGTIATNSRTPMPQRLAAIYREILTVIDNFQPQVMVLEKVFVHYHHPTTAFLLGQARGIICLAAAATKIPLTEYAATQVKKAVVGKGHATKEQVQRMVCALLNMKQAPKYYDTTDALALALTYRYLHTQSSLHQILRGKTS
jgi:crossover junction endodeoxyribonuclease RuvC